MSHNQQPMSIEAMLDMERKEVLALLENRARPNPNPNASPERMRSASPYTTPRSPVRSMLDIGNDPAPSSPRRAPIRSMLDTSSPPPSNARSMLDPESPPAGPSKLPGTSTTPNSPVAHHAELAKAQGPGSALHMRSFSDAATKPVDFGPRASVGRNDPTSDYQFSGILSPTTSQLPKRNTQGGKRQSAGAIAEALRGGDLSALQIPGDRGRHQSFGGRLGGNKSKSPNNSQRISSRSRSPASFSPKVIPGTAILDDGQVLDISNAYRRLSDANLAFSGGTLSQLPGRKQSDSRNKGRLIKDYMGPDGEHLGSSEDDEPFSSDDEDRGRKKDPRSLNPDAKADGDDETVDNEPRSSSNKRTRKTMSLLAAAEEERTEVASQQPKYVYRSLLSEPEIKVTNPSGDNVKPSKNSVHPNTSYDQEPGSATASMIGSDEEADMDDIKRAQKLSFSMTNVIANPEAHRAIRIIYRGEYAKIAQAAEDEHHRLRKYLVATDLSEESTHALEWAIGTVLRDGDTLLAIYCVDEETGIAGADCPVVPDDPKAMREQAAALNSVANSKSQPQTMTAVPDFVRASAMHLRGDSRASTPNTSPAPSSRGDRNGAAEDRRRAVKDITDRVLRLLRKTHLQVRVIVEVLHCKNPKHLITEVIDLVSPTLVVIGSRGRSALKGVILGSFSNYLVTKSSVPVMVARKRLRKQGKYKRADVKQVNNLSNPTAKSLANAKID
ncbi:Usp family protein [Ilyonectria robusta]|uniref:Usp family protein n=1 Tax=Ilyonectria robusta TaxID=1079257 RepID=UPI001E8CDE47|nr:Usp family protein [Ilyonectria robusta]KAH6982173.1 Usp family protein [Ilyonectria sp. MPI-CAGE-AT-0026]KAH8729333.1 Usp family protein [Ilyonectria robusta]